jgi:uncharacterized protein YcaQ
VTVRVLSTRELNRSLLARQRLLERSPLSVPRVLERVAGLQTQYAPSGYIGLWSRVRGFRRELLTDALVRRRAVQATLMRVTIHTLSRRDYRLFAAGIRRGRRDWWLGGRRQEAEGLDMNRVADRVRHHLADGPLRAPDLAARLRADRFPPVAWSGAGLWVDLVRVPPSGTWDQRRADLYGLADDWLGPSEASDASEADGMEHLVRRYLGAFGPATLGDLASWAGLPVTTLRPVVERMRLRRFRDERGRDLVDVPGGILPDAETPAPVRFLPTWDATLLVHSRRTQILPERYRGLVFSTRTPHSVATFLVDGAVAGSWRHEGGGVRLEPFDRLTRATRRELEDEAEGLAAFHAE